MMHSVVELLEEDSQTLRINGYLVSIKHNDIGFSIDIYKEAPLDTILLKEEVYYFEDLEEEFTNDANKS